MLYGKKIVCCAFYLKCLFRYGIQKKEKIKFLNKIKLVLETVSKSIIDARFFVLVLIYETMEFGKYKLRHAKLLHFLLKRKLKIIKSVHLYTAPNIQVHVSHSL